MHVQAPLSLYVFLMRQVVLSETETDFSRFLA